jgi:hypothetical protein
MGCCLPVTALGLEDKRPVRCSLLLMQALEQQLQELAEAHAEATRLQQVREQLTQQYDTSKQVIVL